MKPKFPIKTNGHRFNLQSSSQKTYKCQCCNLEVEYFTTFGNKIYIISQEGYLISAETMITCDEMLVKELIE